MRKEVKKTIKDDDGAPHEYTIMLHGAVEGYKLGRRVLSVAAKCAGIIEPLLKSMSGANTVEEAASAMQGIDGGAIQEALTQLVEGLDSEMVEDLLRYVDRDGKNAKADFNTIYQGNYGELLAAITFALEANFAKMFKRLFTGKLSG